MRVLIKILFSVILLLQIASCKSIDNNNDIYPPNGLVPDEETAIKIAEAIWVPLYGESVYNQRPYEVKLENDIWIVEGTYGESLEKMVLGGVAYTEIQRKDGKIRKVWHTIG